MIIKVDDDLDLRKIADSGQCFRWEPVSDDGYRIIHRKSCIYIYPEGEAGFRLTCDEDEFEEIWRDYFDLGESYSNIRKRIDRDDDPFLYDACEYGRGIRILRQDPWETLISFIISQNRNIPAIKNSISILCDVVSHTVTDRRGVTFNAFPTPEEILSLSDAELSMCRLGYRDKYILSAARMVAEGAILAEPLFDADEETTTETLTSIHGVGKKVAGCVSLFGLHHIDAFPIDVWIRRVLDKEYPGGYPLDKYAPYNGIYQQYMFYYARSDAWEC